MAHADGGDAAMTLVRLAAQCPKADSTNSHTMCGMPNHPTASITGYYCGMLTRFDFSFLF